MVNMNQHLSVRKCACARARPAGQRMELRDSTDSTPDCAINRTRRHALGVFSGALLCALFPAAATYAQQPAKKEHVFKGKVEKVDEKARMLTVNSENVPGWMPAMTMVYKVDKEAVLKSIKPGAQITATVYDGDFATLYNIKVVRAAPAAPKK